VPPSIAPFQFERSPTNAGAFASLQCIASVGDTPIKIEWDFPNVGADTSVSTMSIGERVSMLTVTEVQARHAGNYTCYAQNRASKVSHTAQLFVNGLWNFFGAKIFLHFPFLANISREYHICFPFLVNISWYLTSVFSLLSQYFLGISLLCFPFLVNISGVYNFCVSPS